MKHAIGYLLELRLKARGNPEGVAFIDRALAILAEARNATPDEIASLEAEIDQLGKDLKRRYGRARSVRVH